MEKLKKFIRFCLYFFFTTTALCGPSYGFEFVTLIGFVRNAYNISVDNFLLYKLSSPSNIYNIEPPVRDAGGVHFFESNTHNIGLFGLSPGDKIVVLMFYEENSGTSYHAGYFAETMVTLDADYAVYYLSTMNTRRIPVPNKRSAIGQDVILEWDNLITSDSNIIGYNVYRSSNPESGFNKINTNLIETNTYTDNPDLTEGKEYYYAIELVFSGNIVSTCLSASYGPIYDSRPSEGSVGGRVMTSVTGQNAPITGAKITLIETGDVTLSNNFGIYIFSNIPSGTYSLKIEKENYLPKIITDYQLGDLGQTVSLDFLNWDANQDGKKGLEEAIDALKTVSGIGN